MQEGKNNIIDEIKTKMKFILGNIFYKNKVYDDYFEFKSFCIYKTEKDFEGMKDSKIVINETEMETNFKFNKGLKIPFLNFYFNFYSFKVPYKETENFPIQNKVFLELEDDRYGILFLVFDYKKGTGRHGELVLYNDNTMFLRQSIKNGMYFTVRKRNVTDLPKNRKQLKYAYFLSKFPTFSKKILLYEKETNRYEESASVLYENLIDLGYKNVYFIINKESEQFKLIGEEYRENLIYAHTFKHYYNFFKCKTFLSSESLQHALELRVASKYSGRKLNNKKFKYVFLQHGVMYMISIDSDNRSFFKKGVSMPKDAKVVVSSKKEAQHFIDKGGFSEKDLYITGLPKFDRAVLNSNNDKITIMPTWRPWEYNEVRNNYKSSGYYKMLIEIISAIPEKLKNKIVLLPHPLIVEQLQKTDLNTYIPNIISYDEILRNTKILITDYSSIAYDAFYRGSNVIFWWKEKDFCMEQYNGSLMLKKDDAFGDICYNIKELKKSVEKNYTIKQEQEYVDLYSELVEFKDNKNTERLIRFLEKDKIIKRSKFND